MKSSTKINRLTREKKTIITKTFFSFCPQLSLNKNVMCSKQYAKIKFTTLSQKKLHESQIDKKK